MTEITTTRRTINPNIPEGLEQITLRAMEKDPDKRYQSAEEMLKDINRKTANISKDGVEITARAVKKGFSSETIYCKHCGNSIDADSRFCKTCGKEQ